MIVLVLNAGSSSLKFQLIRTDEEAVARGTEERLLRGTMEHIGGHAIVTAETPDRPRRVREMPIRDLREAVDGIIRWILSPEGVDAVTSHADIHAVGHRVVHGGQRFRESVRIDDEVIAGIEDHVELAPLHNPANIDCIRAASEILGSGVPQVAVFDTAFHATMAPEAFLYAIPYHYYRRFRIRRYGFHGTSHRYVAQQYREMTGMPKERVKIITLHLGNGCSACAIDGGESQDTSMGFTPLEGLVMGTRSGNIDPSLVQFLAYKEGASVAEVETILNKQSGMLGISGMTSDMRELQEELEETDDRRVKLAIDIFCRSVRQRIGSYFATLGGAEAVVFAGGIGENSAAVRAKICEGLECLGLELDPARNEQMIAGAAGEISAEGSRLKAFVNPTDEELLIARDTMRVVADRQIRS